MIKTITISTTRIESIKKQYAYALKLLGDMKMNRLTQFLKEIEAKNISEISFHGLKPNSNQSYEDIFFTVDWDKHSELIHQGKKYIEEDDTFEDGAAPETLIECHLFKEKCKDKGLKIEMRVRYPKHITNNSTARAKLNKNLGLCPVKPEEQIVYSNNPSYKSEVQINAIEEMSITRYSN